MDETQTNEERLLYTFEFDLLPKMLYGERGKDLISVIGVDGVKFFSDLLGRLAKSAEITPMYTEKDFSVEIINSVFERDNSRIFLMKMDMPVPENHTAPLSSQIFICFNFCDDDIRCVRYYTKEPEVDREKLEELLGYKFTHLKEASTFLCGVDEEGKHLNYGIISENPEEILNRVMEIYVNYLDSHISGK